MNSALEKPLADSSNKGKLGFMETITLRLFAYTKGSKFYACCVELDLVSQGKTMEEAIDRLQKTIEFYVNSEYKEGKKFSQIVRKPSLYFLMVYAYVILRVLVSVLRSKVTSKYAVIAGTLNGATLTFPDFLTA